MNSKEFFLSTSTLKKPENPQLPDLIRHRFREVILSNFENHLLYSFLAGRVAHGVREPTSDIDCIVVLKDSASSDNVIEKRIKGFVDGYLEIHDFFGFSPDLSFSGDVITETQKEEAIAGRGFFSEGRFQCLPITTEEDWDRENVDYRVWLTELTFNNDMFIAGNQNLFLLDSNRAIETLVKFLLIQDHKKEFFPIELTEIIRDGGNQFLGFSRNYGNLENYIEKKIRSSFQRLLIDGFVIQNSIDGQISVVEDRLTEWRKQAISGATKPVTYLMSWLDIRDYVDLQKGAKN